MCKRNIDRLPFACPQLGNWSVTQACALRGIEPATFWFVGGRLAHWAASVRPDAFFLNNSHFNVYEVVSHCGFDFFPWCLMMLNIFYVLIEYLNIFFGDMSVQTICPCLHWATWLFVVELYVLYLFCILGPYQIHDLELFSPFCRFPGVLWGTEAFHFHEV